ncbi:MAG: YdjY domain-containing protein [Gemmataceae bacterium]
MALACEKPAQTRKTSSSGEKKPTEKEGKKVRVSENVTLEVFPDSRRVWVNAVVCLREGPLEQLLTRKGRKEHEAILAADADARKIHEALLLAKAKEGRPVRWQPVFQPPTGSTIRITLKYQDKGEEVTVSARSWIKNSKTGKELESDWVFAGSILLDNQDDKSAPKHYLANDGDVICVANFESAMLDLPMKSAKDDAERGYVAWTEKIPPIGTAVQVLLEPVPEVREPSSAKSKKETRSPE